MNLASSPYKIMGIFIAFSLLLCLAGCDREPSSPAGHNTWRQYGGGADQSKYVDADQITKENVSQMEVAWVYPSGDTLFYFFNPIVVDTTMYVMGKNFSLIAVNALTGKEVWIHANLQGLSRRGISYWESKDKKDKRLLFSFNNTLQAIDASTGKSILSFGDSGSVDMRYGLDRDPLSIRRMQSNTPGVVFEDLIVMGSAPGEGYFSPPGHVRAYNIVTGKLQWTFHTIPYPGEFGYETWPKDAYRYSGGVNVWSEMSLDQARGIVYLPLGSPTYDYYGADREGSNLFGNSLVALDVRTGKRLWHFQTVHHDLWDCDLASAPQLITVNREGKKIDAVAVATKHGFMFVFDRVTGDPVWPIQEKPFPASEMPGEKSWPTQPIPAVVPSFTRHQVTKETLNPYYSEQERKKWEQRIDTARTGLFMPPSDKFETIMMPGALGGVNFGNTAADPAKGIVYILTQEHPSVYKLNKIRAPQEILSTDELKKARGLYASSCQTCHGANMSGGIAPSLVNAGERMSLDDFKNVLVSGRGLMPGFPHIDEQSVTALYRFLGGVPGRRFGFGRKNDLSIVPDGPVVASGGAPVKPDPKTSPPMSNYPDGVPHPADRYTTDYGIDWNNLLTPPWARIMAYDLNTGTVKWEKPLGEDPIALSKGDKNSGAPGGSLRKGIVVTSTGVVFCTGKGGKVYAFDADNGDVLWESNLSHESNALPAMFEIGGRQYLVVSATSGFAKESADRSKEPGALPRGYVVYALPESK